MTSSPPSGSADTSAQAPPGWPGSRPWAGSGWLSVGEARRTQGVRVTDSPYWGAWWAQALRAILHVKRIHYRKVVHPPYRDQDPDAQRELREWTAQTSVPVMAYHDGSDRGDVIKSDWLGQLMLAESIAPVPSLVPADPRQRSTVIGLASELMSPQGLMWNARLAMSDLYRGSEMTEKQRSFFGRGAFLGGKYSHNGRPGTPLENVRESLALLEQQLAENAGRGSRFFVGDDLTALDVYWVYASNFVRILPPDELPVMRFNRAMYPPINEALAGEQTSRLMAHRDHVLHTFLQCPVVVD